MSAERDRTGSGDQGLNGFKVTEIGNIPDDWEVRQLLEVVSLPKGQVDPRDDPYRSMILVAPDHIESRTGRLLARQTAGDQQAISGKYEFRSKDIVYSKIRPYLRKAMLADFPGLCSADMYPLRPAIGVAPGFILAVLLGERFSRFAESVSARSGIPKVNRHELSEYRVAVPPTEEQYAIASALSDLDAAGHALDELISKKQAILQGIMQQLLTGETRLPGFSAEWETVTMAAIGATYGGLSGKSKEDFGTGNAFYVPFLNVLENVRIDLNALESVWVASSESQNAVQVGDILFNATSETPGDLAMGAVVAATVPRLYLNSFCFGFRLRRPNEYNALFLAFAFRGGIGRRLLYSLAQGATRYNLSKAQFGRLEMRLPCFDEQSEIATILSDADAEITSLERRREKLKAIKEGMKQALLTGQVRLPREEAVA